MEDLRPKQSTIPEAGAVNTYTDHLPRFVIGKKFRQITYRIILIGLVVVALKYPFEIGDTIGKWVHNFYTGLTHRF